MSETYPAHGSFIQAKRTNGPDYDMHYGLELGVVLSGRMRRYYRAWETEIGPGQVWLCGMWERHGWQVVTPACASFGVIFVPQVLLQTRFPEEPDIDWMAPFRVPPRRRPQAGNEAGREILAITQRFEPKLPPQGSAEPAVLRLLVLEVLLALMRNWIAPVPKQIWRDEADYSLVSRAVEMALGRRAKTTAEAAQACGMSTRAFARVFEGLIGISFSKFALRHRLSEAAAQLLVTSDSVAAIARSQGFTSASHFHHAFVKHYHVSPAAYREKRG